MKAIILAGGQGSRISEETHLRPKPMIEIGGRPILWHILKTYSNYGINEFIICCGYKGYLIKEYFANYFLHTSDITFNMVNNEILIHEIHTEPWQITLIDTGEKTETGGRLKRVRNYVQGEHSFCFTYGDGLSDINIKNLIDFHYQHKKKATITAVRPPGRYGALQVRGNSVTGFMEKPKGDGGYINGGFFVLKPECLELIDGDNTVWEKTPLDCLSQQGELMAYHHDGFWQPMDTLREKLLLEQLWDSGEPPWLQH